MTEQDADLATRNTIGRARQNFCLRQEGDLTMIITQQAPMKCERAPHQFRRPLRNDIEIDTANRGRLGPIIVSSNSYLREEVWASIGEYLILKPMFQSDRIDLDRVFWVAFDFIDQKRSSIPVDNSKICKSGPFSVGIKCGIGVSKKKCCLSRLLLGLQHLMGDLLRLLAHLLVKIQEGNGCDSRRDITVQTAEPVSVAYDSDCVRAAPATREVETFGSKNRGSGCDEKDKRRYDYDEKRNPLDHSMNLAAAASTWKAAA